MDTKLTLNINKRVVSKAKSYAKKQGRSLSDLVENYLKVVTSGELPEKEDILSQVSPRLRKLVGIAKKIPKDIDHQELISEYLTQKYLK